MNKYIFLTFFLAYSSLAFSQRVLIEKTDSLLDILESYGAKHNKVTEQERFVQYFIVCDEYEETDEPLYKIENDKVVPFSESEMKHLRNKWANSKKMAQAIKKYLFDLKEVAVSQNHWEKHVNGTDSVMWSMTFDEECNLSPTIKKQLSDLKKLDTPQNHSVMHFNGSDITCSEVSIVRDILLRFTPESTLEYEYKPIKIAEKHPEFRYRIPKNTMSLWIKLRTDINLLPEVESKAVSEKRYFGYIAPIFNNKKIKVSPIEFPDNVGTLYQINDKNLADSVLTQIKAKTKEYYRENPNEVHEYSRNVNYKDNALIIQNENDHDKMYCLGVNKVGNAYYICTFVGSGIVPADLYTNSKYIKK